MYFVVIHRRDPVSTMSWWILLLVLCSRYCQNSAISCDSTQFEYEGRCCSLCMPGQKLVSECTEKSETLCAACKTGEYQDKWNRETDCLLHQNCDETLGFKKIKEGSMEKNVECICQEGKHCSSIACETCVWNTPCGQGEGVIRIADKYLDTECAQCIHGTFSNVTSDKEPCKAWQRCSYSQKEIHPGTEKTDVVCGPSATWIYIVVFLIALLSIGLAVSFFIMTKRRRQNKAAIYQPPQDPPKNENEDPLLIHKHNLPEEDQDITMQGLPVAQEEGKDYHMSQEEV
ncbi:tumor necrosis factor receptor superfamily member 5 isoform X2 [Pyxicephalus adspersus]|uniref:tumor necrosis factor receptor superfamily member 5 isoform X2 n=1 Tax=Pyxicephalus adspersus TaxID=30357 RepID=UPI003B59AEF3